MKPLTAEGRFECGFDELTRGKVCAVTPVMAKGCVGLGLATANEPGYHLIPVNWVHADKWEEMRAHAAALNLELFGLDEKAAARVVCSSMFHKRAK